MADIQTQLPIKGHLTNNNAAPAASDNLGVLPALANAAVPTWTEGDQVLLSADLSGGLRTNATITGTPNVNLSQVGGVAVALGQVPAASSIPVVLASGTNVSVVGTLTNNNAAPAANNVGVLPALANTIAPTYTNGDQVLLSTDTSGSLRTTATGTSSVNVAQFGGTNVSLGQALAGASIPVVLPSGTNVPVTFAETSTGIVTSFTDVSAVANAATGTISYVAGGVTGLFLKQVIASASGGPCRVQVDYGAGPTIICVGFTSTSNPNYVVDFAQPILIATGTTVNIKIMNNAGAAQDVYGTIIGHEV